MKINRIILISNIVMKNKNNRYNTKQHLFQYLLRILFVGYKINIKQKKY